MPEINKEYYTLDLRMTCACNFACTVSRLVAEVGHLLGHIIGSRRSSYGRHGPLLEPSQLFRGVDRVLLGLVFHLLAHILRHVTSRVISPLDWCEHDVVHRTPNSSKNPRTTTASPGDDDGPYNDRQEDPGDANDEEQHEQQHGNGTEDPVQGDK